MIALLLVLIVVGLIWSISSNSRRTRESQERMEKVMLSQVPPAPDIDGYPAAVVEAVRKKNTLGAIAEMRKARGLGFPEAKHEVDLLRAKIEA